MAYCTNCGHQLADGSKFCSACGNKVDASPVANNEQRKTVYEGKIYKCPSCGESVPGFAASCPTCGHEFRGLESSGSARELAYKLERASSDEQKANLIRHFPIPNTREDILEFMILASTNMENSFKQEVSEAWSVKFEQA